MEDSLDLCMGFRGWLLESEVVAMGRCFPYANNLAMEMLRDGVFRGDDIFVCHGEVEEPLAVSPKRYLHAWVEAEGRVYDWQMMTARVGSITKEDFYRMYKPSGVRRYTVERSMVNCVRHGHHGPW